MGYVGQTVNTLSGRWKGHRRNADHPETQAGQWEFPKAIREHGGEAFAGRIICKCNTPEELDVAENKWVAELNTLWPHGYNMLPGGSGKDEQTRRLISERTKAAMSKGDQTWKERQREAMSRHEVKQKISERTLIAMNKPEMKARMTAIMASDEHRQVISNRTKEAMHRTEVREKQLSGLVSIEGKENIRRAHADPEYIKKQSETKLRASQDPEYRRKISERTRLAMQRPEVKARMKLRQKKKSTDARCR